MASGYGLNGVQLALPSYAESTLRLLTKYAGVSRCFPFWQEVLACYVVNTNTDDDSGKKKCGPALEDYYECLHHKKEAARIRAIQAAYRKKEAEYPRENVPSAEAIRNLGLIGKEEDTKLVLESGRSR
ncbi:MAG: hypothetical protein M1833_001313 [Piccolia ochrophora]|nr:MAG: hypothetical protein M1833_001313 [Piccolia ochrophora]